MRNRAENQVNLVCIRHGATQANEERRYLGKTDEPLSKSGMEALRSYKEQKRYPAVTHLFCSPMKRCMETAKILYPGICPAVIAEWEEIDFGRFEYQNYEQLKDDGEYQAWIDSGGRLAFPEGEAQKDFILRCESGFVRMCDELRRRAQGTEEPVSAGMIVHGGTIMALLSLHGEKDYFDYQVSCGSGYTGRMTGWGSSARIEEITEI